MRISDWSSDVCSSDLADRPPYMDAPSLPSIHFMTVRRKRLQPYIRTFAVVFTTVPDGICWLAPQSLVRAQCRIGGHGLYQPRSDLSCHQCCDCLCNLPGVPL